MKFAENKKIMHKTAAASLCIMPIDFYLFGLCLVNFNV